METEQAQRIAGWQMRTLGKALIAGGVAFAFFAGLATFINVPVLLIVGIAAGPIAAGIALRDVNAVREMATTSRPRG